MNLSLHAVPWTRTDFGGAILRNAGPDFLSLSRFGDFLDPMNYTQMLERSPAGFTRWW
jgi:hypothetical protein